MLVLASESLMQWKDEFRLNEFFSGHLWLWLYSYFVDSKSLQYVETSQKILAFIIWVGIVLIFFLSNAEINRRLMNQNGDF